MSVSANFTQNNSRINALTNSKPKKCQKCPTLATSRTHCGDYCTDCFLSTNHKRFSYTCGRAGLRKFDRVIVPFDGDAKSQVLFHHLQEYDSFVVPLPYNIHNADHCDATTELPCAVSTLDISVQKKEKKPKKGDPDDSASISDVIEEPVPAKPTTTTQIPPFKPLSEQSPFIQQFTSRNAFHPTLPDALYTPSFPFNMNQDDNLYLPMMSQESDVNMTLFSRLTNSSELHPGRTNRKSSLHYCCLFIHVDCSRINALLATNGKDIHKTEYHNNFKFVQNLAHPSSNDSHTLPYSYPTVALYDVTPIGHTKRVMPYIYTHDTPTPRVVGSQLISNATTLPILVIPFEHVIPESLVVPEDRVYAERAVQELISLHEDSHVDIAYYITLYARTFAFYRMTTQHFATVQKGPYELPLSSAALNNWQKVNPSYYSSIYDLVTVLKRAILTQCAVVFKMRAVLQTQTTEDLSAAIISGLSKARPDMWLPCLVQWHGTNQFSKRQAAFNATVAENEKICGSFIDISRVDEVIADEKRLKNDKYMINHAHNGILNIKVPYVNVFYESSYKILYLHLFYVNKLAQKGNIAVYPIIKPIQPVLFWLQTEYNNLHGSSLPLVSHSKNIDRITMNFIRTITSTNDSSVSNVIKTCDKLSPQYDLQKFHTKYTQNKDIQQQYYNQLHTTGLCTKIEENTDGSPKKSNDTSNGNITQNQLLPVLIYNNTSDGWYGQRCTFCTAMIAQFPSLPIPPPAHPTTRSQQLNNTHFKELCPNCQIVYTDCDPTNVWLSELHH